MSALSAARPQAEHSRKLGLSRQIAKSKAEKLVRIAIQCLLSARLWLSRNSRESGNGSGSSRAHTTRGHRRAEFSRKRARADRSSVRSKVRESKEQHRRRPADSLSGACQ